MNLNKFILHSSIFCFKEDDLNSLQNELDQKEVWYMTETGTSSNTEKKPWLKDLENYYYQPVMTVNGASQASTEYLHVYGNMSLDEFKAMLGEV